MTQRAIPRDGGFDHSLALLREGYEFIMKRCERHQSDLFETRLMMTRTLCMRGEEAAKRFYDNEYFVRRDAAPASVQTTLLGDGGVQGMDDAAHRQRKAMFMSLLAADRVAALLAITAKEWARYAERWQKMERVVLFGQVQEILCRAVCSWAGIPLPEEDVARRTADLSALMDSAGGIGARRRHAKRVRERSEQWMVELIDHVRSGRMHPDESTALHVIALHRDFTGAELKTPIAAVELLNVLRPTVAVARFIVFAAHALHKHPECRLRLAAERDYPDLFVQEVRRVYPYFPFVAARVRKSFEWNGYTLPRGRRVLLDLYGTSHDARIWDRPDEFQPERFRGWQGRPFAFIPQGGGNHHRQHRCAGEDLTGQLIKQGLRFLLQSLTYRVPEQDLSINLGRMPTLPQSGFVLEDVRLAGRQYEAGGRTLARAEDSGQPPVVAPVPGPSNDASAPPSRSAMRP